MTETTLASLLEAVRENGSLHAAALTLGIPRHTLSNRIAQAAIAEGFPANASQEEKLRADIRALKAQAKSDQVAEATHAEVREAIFGLARAPLSPPAWVARQARSGKHAATVPVFMLGDQHFAEVVRPGQSYGNEYNSEIGAKRMRRVVERCIDLCFNHMTTPSYPGIVVPLMGDTVTGDIHDELRVTNDQNLLPSVIFAAEILVAALRRLADAFGKVYAPAVAGNHGRTTKRIEAKDFSAKNFDWLIYQMVERELAALGDDRITISSNEANANRFDVLGHRFLQMHGHDLGVKGGDGIIGALGPIMRGRLKVGAQQQALGYDFDTLLLGHWHQYITLPGLVVNNTLKGYDEFAANILRAKPSTPSQALFFVHPDHGITYRLEVFAEDTPIGAGRRDWVSWPA